MSSAKTRALIVEVFALSPPITAYDYSHEAITTVGAERQFFYGHSTNEVIAKVLAERMRKVNQQSGEGGT